MKPPNDFRIKPASHSHVGQLASLARSYSLREMASDRASEVGFLVSDFGEAHYHDFLGRANHFYVLLEKTSVLGFVLAYSSDRIQGDEWLNLLIKDRHPEPFVLIKQICIRQDVTGESLATQLYHYIFQHSPQSDLFAAVVLHPPNARSVTFHEKLGFIKIFEVQCPDGILRGVWMSPAAAAS